MCVLADKMLVLSILSITLNTFSEQRMIDPSSGQQLTITWADDDSSFTISTIETEHI